MRQRATLLGVLLLGLFALAAFPIHHGLVTDDAHILSVEESQIIESKLRDLERRRSAEVAVVTVNSLDGMEIEEYAERLFRAWGIGKAAKDNGVLFLLAPKAGRTGRARIEVGYGLEPVLTDGVTGDILRDRVRPGWRSSHPATGVLAGVDAIIEKLDAPLPQAAVGSHALDAELTQERSMFWPVAISLFLVGTVVMMVAASVHRRRKQIQEEEAENYRTMARQQAIREQTRAVYPPPYVPRAPRRTVSSTPAPTPSYRAPDPEPYRPSSSSSDWGSSSSSSSSSDFNFGGGSSGGGGSSSDL